MIFAKITTVWKYPKNCIKFYLLNFRFQIKTDATARLKVWRKILSSNLYVYILNITLLNRGDFQFCMISQALSLSLSLSLWLFFVILYELFFLRLNRWWPAGFTRAKDTHITGHVNYERILEHSLSLSLSLSLSQTHTHTHTHFWGKGDRGDSVCGLIKRCPLTSFLSLSHSHSPSSLSHPHTHTCSQFLSLSHTHTHAHTHIHLHSLFWYGKSILGWEKIPWEIFDISIFFFFFHLNQFFFTFLLFNKGQKFKGRDQMGTFSVTIMQFWWVKLCWGCWKEVGSHAELRGTFVRA